MNEYCMEFLKKMYDDTVSDLSPKSKKGTSLIILILSKRKTNVRKSLKNSSHREGGHPGEVVKELLQAGLIKESALNEYVLTAKGILFVEEKIYHIDPDCYHEWIQKEYLDIDSEPISDRNRIVLLSVFATHCFSETNAALANTEEQRDSLLNLFKESESFLLDLGLIKKTIEDTNPKSKTLLAQITSQIDRLPDTTSFLFSSGKNKYYLQVSNKEGIDRKKITFLTKLILGPNPSYEQVEKLESFCEGATFNYSYKISSGSGFNDSKSRLLIKAGINDALI